jgi:hypothetical protein
MAQEHQGMHCVACGTRTMFVRDTYPPNHVVHLLATIFLCGLWLPVWITIALWPVPCGPWLCTKCGGGVGTNPFIHEYQAEPPPIQ